MDYKYVVDEYDDVIFIGTAEECLAVLDNNIHAVAIRDTRYRKNAIEKMAMRLSEREEMTESEVKKDWYSALRDVRYGVELSKVIGYGFGFQDLIVLGTLHEYNMFREKIENLLEDCNFHTENELLIKGKYNEYFKYVIKEGIV